VNVSINILSTLEVLSDQARKSLWMLMDYLVQKTKQPSQRQGTTLPLNLKIVSTPLQTSSQR